MPEINRTEIHEDPVNGRVNEVRTTTETTEVPPPLVVPSAVVEHTETTVTNTDWLARRRYSLMRISQLVWLVAGIIEALIGIRFVLKLMAANPNAGFAQFIYGITAPFLATFVNLTATPSVDGSVLEFWSLIAIVVYALLAWAIVKIIWILFYKPPSNTMNVP